jgi:4-diphosphocytidyl-2-C-methyl-D-erythritol kinase
MHCIKNEAVLLTPAKINLHLAVGKKRADGYHEILSVFQQISLFDTIRIKKISNTPSCTIAGMGDITLEDNIMYKAYRVFTSRTGVRIGIDITIKKKIPKKAGLGGGSSDAASILIGLNEMCGTEFGPNELAELGALVGSDVPFFCHTTPAAVVGGRGEDVHPLIEARLFHGLLVCGRFDIETARAYRWIDAAAHEDGDSRYKERTELVREYIDVNPDRWQFFNSFQPVVSRLYPAAEAIFSDLRANGAIFTSISGSGSSVFGLFRNESDAFTAYKNMNRSNGKVWKIKTLERCPIAVVQ